MGIEITTLDPRGAEYAALALATPGGLPYAEPEHLDFLSRALPGCETVILAALDGGCPVAALPCMIHPGGTVGPVVNSLPFFGSNGGLLPAPDAPNPATAGRALLGALRGLCTERRAAACTVVSNPLAPQHALYAEFSGHTHTDARTGQIAPLPAPAPEADPEAALDEALMAAFHSKTRNMVRKALSCGVTAAVETSEEAMRVAHALHEAAMAEIGGTAKPWPVFQALMDSFAPGGGYEVLTARRGGDVVAALVVLYGSRCAEYYMPATRAGFRACQPMSLLVLAGMRRAASRGLAHWNFGGTWDCQEGVHRFKARFGARNLPYHYFTTVYDRGLLRATPAELLAACPRFYVLPFAALGQGALGAAARPTPQGAQA